MALGMMRLSVVLNHSYAALKGYGADKYDNPMLRCQKWVPTPHCDDCET